MKTAEIIRRIERLAPPQLAADWDNSGVQIAGQAQNVGRLAVCLDPLPDTLQACLGWSAHFVLSHHPLYFKPQAPDQESAYLRILRDMLPAGAWLYAAHTSLDQAPGGPAFWLGAELGLRDPAPLEPAADPELAAQGAGLGQIGDLPQDMAWSDFLGALAQRLDRQVWSVAGRPPSRVARVAYCPGSGGSLMDAAKAAGADVFITGDIKYHQALEAQI
ncbi:MAG: Nif3-like dinuclear metal center hexameric protein, partial [Desulfovibrionaceae bacterium]